MSPQQLSIPDVDAALGVALTSSAVGMVLVEGSLAEGATLDHDCFATDPGTWSSTLGIAQQVSDAVTRTCAISAAHGYHVRSIGLTWNADADAAATAALNSLGATSTNRTSTNRVVAVALQHAGAALLTWRTRSGVDSGPSAFCALSGDTAMVVRLDDQKHLWHESIDASSVMGRLHRRDRRPEVLFAIGSADEAAALTSQAESVLGARVSTPNEALLALARGAALIAARDGRNLGTAAWEEQLAGSGHRMRKWALSAAVTAVIAGAAWSIFAVDWWHSTPSEVLPVGGSPTTVSPSVKAPVPTTIAVVSAQPSPLPVTVAPDPPSVTLPRVTRVAVPSPTDAPTVEHLPLSNGSAPGSPGPGN